MSFWFGALFHSTFRRSHQLTTPINDKVLDFPLALFYATILFYVISCAAISISVSSLLRLLSILNNSEEAVIQILGLDEKVIVYIRIGSFAISSLTIFVALFVFNSVPPGMVILVTNQTIAFPKLINDNPATILYFLSLIGALILTTSANIVNNMDLNLLLLNLLHLSLVLRKHYLNRKDLQQFASEKSTHKILFSFLTLYVFELQSLIIASGFFKDLALLFSETTNSIAGNFNFHV